MFIGNFLCLLAEARIIILEQLKAFGWGKKRLLIEIVVLPAEEKQVVLFYFFYFFLQCVRLHTTHGLLQRSANDLLG